MALGPGGGYGPGCAVCSVVGSMVLKHFHGPNFATPSPKTGWRCWVPYILPPGENRRFWGRARPSGQVLRASLLSYMFIISMWDSGEARGA